LALDGDADRLIVVDEQGRLIDGDQLMALIALDYQRRGILRGSVVATVMSNLGFERRLGEAGIDLVRTQVGDRYVLEAMRDRGCNVGGEQSGHIILTDHSTTGDGLVAALQVLAAVVDSGKRASEVLDQFQPVPQLLKNVRFNGGSPLDNEAVKQRIAEGERELSGRGRLLIRKSGTEPLIRVMAEGDDPALVERIVDGICEAVQSAA
jgi:phosphoglucosamine mutase